MAVLPRRLAWRVEMDFVTGHSTLTNIRFYRLVMVQEVHIHQGIRNYFRSTENVWIF